MGDLSAFGENMRACAVYHPLSGIFESIIIMPEKEVATYSTGNDLTFEWIDDLDIVPLDGLQKHQQIRRIGPLDYVVENIPS